MENKLNHYGKQAKYSISLFLVVIISLFAGCKGSHDLVNSFGKQIKDKSQIHTYINLFEGGLNEIHSFRIPSVIRTTDGTLIAFAECRNRSKSDRGDIDLVYKRSTDNGTTWSELGVIEDDGPFTWGNPTAVTDWITGRVWIFFNWDSGAQKPVTKIKKWGDRKVYSSYSDDNGATWSKAQDMTNTLLPENYKWDAVGPGVGIQTERSNNGRLIIPATGRNIYSDDYGTTWHYQIIPSGTGEGTIVEQPDGTLMRNDRPVRGQWELIKKRRISTGSIENGFSSFVPDKKLDDPKCEASTYRYNWDSPDRIIFLNSDSNATRCKMKVRISYDQGETWPVSRNIYDSLTEEEAKAQGKGGYSSMTRTSDNCIGALIETRNSNGNHSIEFHKFNLSWILDGRTE